MSSFYDDLRYAARMLIRNPGFTVVAVLSLALGIGANTGIFSLVNAALLRPLPVEHPEELVAIYTSDYSGPPFSSSSYPDYLDFRDKTSVFSGVVAHSLSPASVTIGDRSERALGALVTGNYFELLGVPAARGRTFGREEDQTPGAHSVAVIGHAFWQRLGGRDDILGQTMNVNGHPFTIIGIAPASFTGLLRGLDADLWMPSSSIGQVNPGSQSALSQRSSRRWMLMARLAPGKTREEAQSAMTVLASQLAEAYPPAWRDVRQAVRRVTVVAERDARVRPNIRGSVIGFMALLMAVVGLVLLIACANVANLLLARAAARRHEIAVRLSLGAPRVRLVRLLLTESVLLSMLAGAAGLLIAFWMTRAIGSFKPPVPLPIALDIDLDASVLGFALALSIVTGLIFGLVPALQSTRPDLVPALKNDDMGLGVAHRRINLRHALVVVQVSLSLLLLVGAGLFVRTLQQSHAIDVGFDATGVVVTSIDLTPRRTTPERGTALYREIIDRLGRLPGVERVSLADSVPLGLGASRQGLEIEGYQPQPNEDMEHHFNFVSPQYFETMKIRVVAGRAFTEEDREGAPPVAMVNEAFAQRFWPGQNPIGRRINVNGAWAEVVGATRDGRYVNMLEETRPYFFLPMWQGYRREAELHVRMRDAGSSALVAAIRRELRAVDPDLPVYAVAFLSDQIGVGLLPQRVAASLLGIFGVLATLLAAIGLYGVLAHAVSARRREIGVRMALGAEPHDILTLVVTEGMQVVGVGLALGMAAAFAVTRLLSTLLYGISPRDPLTFAGTAIVLAVVAFAASYFPARRAARIDPIRVLRNE